MRGQGPVGGLKTRKWVVCAATAHRARQQLSSQTGHRSNIDAGVSLVCVPFELNTRCRIRFRSGLTRPAKYRLSSHCVLLDSSTTCLRSIYSWRCRGKRSPYWLTAACASSSGKPFLSPQQTGECHSSSVTS